MSIQNEHAEFMADRAKTAAEITDAVNANLPAEKARAEKEMAQTAKEVRELGLESDSVDGRGQAAASIPAIIYHRWNQLYPGCWRDKQFVDEFLSDNPQCQLPGYKPKAKPIRFSMRVPKINYGGDIYHQNKQRVAEQARRE